MNHFTTIYESSEQNYNFENAFFKILVYFQNVIPKTVELFAC